MVNHKRIIVFLGGLLIAAQSLIVLPAAAQMFIETHIATGVITNISNNIIELDGKTKYYPVNDSIRVTLDVGKKVTIRYVNSAEKKRKYLELASGLNALSPQKTPSSQRRQKGYK